MKKSTLILIAMLFNLINLSLISAVTNVSECGVLDISGETYIQTTDIIDNGLRDPCMKIIAQNITYDGDGYYIKSNDNYIGIYSTQVNTIIKNTNISMGTLVSGYGIALSNANNSYIYNNILNGQHTGLSLFLGTSNTRIENNTVNSNNVYGIKISLGSNNTLIGNTANLNILSGIDIYSSSNNMIRDNEASSSVMGEGILLYVNSSNNQLINNTVNSELSGISLFYNSNNNQLINNSVNSNIHGIYISSGQNNTLLGNIVNSNRDGISITANSQNNYIYDLKIWNSGSSGCPSAGIFISRSSNNTFEGGYINKSGCNGAEFYSYNSGITSDNIFKDLWIDNSNSKDIYFETNDTNSTCLNNVFLNTSFNSNSVEFDDDFGEGGSMELIRKWYYRAYVNDTDGNDVNNANVSIYNASDSLQTNMLTGAVGFTSIFNIIDYRMYGGGSPTITPYGPYIIKANNLNYSIKSQTYNVTFNENNLKDVFTLSLLNDTSRFYIKNSLGSNIAWFGEGNLVLKGICTAQATCTAPANSFIIGNSTDSTTAYIDMDGNLCIEQGDCSDQSVRCNPTIGAFKIRDMAGSVVSYIDFNGDLCLTGGLYENTDL